jgi:hypothetical protein
MWCSTRQAERNLLASLFVASRFLLSKESLSKTAGDILVEIASA